MSTSMEFLPGDGNPEQSGSFSIQDILSLLGGGKRIIIFSTLLTFLLFALYTFLSKPVFESTTRVVIDFRGARNSQGTIDLTGYTSATKITNEIETLMSYALTEEVAQAMMRKLYVDKAGKELAPILRSPVSKDSQDSLASIREVSRRLREAVEFTAVKESDVIKISARSSDPREAALIARTYAEIYSEMSLSQSRAKSRSVREFLQSQFESKQRLLDSTESNLRAYMQTTGIVAMEDKTRKLVEQLAQLEATRDALDIEINSRDQTLRSYKTELAAQEPNVAKAIGESNDSYIRQLQEKLASLEVNRDYVLAQNPGLNSQSGSSAALSKLDAEIASLRKNLQTRTASYIGSLSPGERAGGTNEGSAGYLAQVKQKIVEQQVELDGLRAKRGALEAVIGDYENQFGQLPRRNIEMAKLQRSRLSIEKLTALVEEKYNEADITEKSEFGSVTIIDPATTPFAPVSPKVGLNLVLGVLLGLGLGVAIVLVRPVFSVKIRAAEDIKRAGLPLLAVVTRMGLDKSGNAVGRKKGKKGNGVDLHLVANTHRNSPIIESYRHLFTSLRYYQIDKPLRRVMVTSVKQGEGKSMTVSNLAIIAAEGERRVLLVDADLRRPTIHSIFGIPKKPGLMELMMGSASLEGIVHAGVLPNLDVLCAGAASPSPSAVIGSAKLGEFISTMADTYDLVLLDCPPLLAVTDPLMLAAVVDGVILVASAGETSFPELAAAVHGLGEMSGKILGVVLNNFDPRRTYRGGSKSYGYGYGYGYASHEASQSKS